MGAAWRLRLLPSGQEEVVAVKKVQWRTQVRACRLLCHRLRGPDMSYTTARLVFTHARDKRWCAILLHSSQTQQIHRPDSDEDDAAIQEAVGELLDDAADFCVICNDNGDDECLLLCDGACLMPPPPPTHPQPPQCLLLQLRRWLPHNKGAVTPLFVHASAPARVRCGMPHILLRAGLGS